MLSLDDGQPFYNWMPQPNLKSNDVVKPMEALVEEKLHCPYCGETIEVLIDCSVEQQEYIEDCQVCCRPITFSVSVPPDGHPQVTTYHEDE